MNIEPFVEDIRHQLLSAAEAGSEDARALAERLIAPLEASVRLALLDAFSAAAADLTSELAPGSVELRMRGRDPEFVVTLPPGEPDLDEADRYGGALGSEPVAGEDLDGDAQSRISLRMPERLKARVELQARREGLSVNAWLVRVAAAAAGGAWSSRRQRRSASGAQRYSGWVR